MLKFTKYYSRYHSEVRQEAVQQALAAMHDKPKQVVPLPSKRASVARPISNVVSADDEHEDMDDDESDIDDDLNDDDHLCETRNLALGLSDTSSAGSLASGHRPHGQPPEAGSAHAQYDNTPGLISRNVTSIQSRPRHFF